MTEIGKKIQEKCLAFADRVIKLNDYLLEQAAKSHLPSSVKHQKVMLVFGTRAEAIKMCPRI